MGIILRALNTERIIPGKARTTLATSFNSGDTTLIVEDISSFAVDDIVMIGQLGEERTVIAQLHGSTAPTDTTITLAAAIAKDINVGAVVQVVGFNQVEFSHAATVAGSKSVLTTTDITADSMDSIFDDTTDTTGFGFYRFKNTTTTTFTDYSDPIPYAGYDPDQAGSILAQALDTASSTETVRIPYSKLFSFLSDFLTEARSRHIRWSDANVHDAELASVVNGVWEYNLPTNIARQNDPSAIIQIRLGQYSRLQYIDTRRFTTLVRELKYSKVATAFTDSATEIVLDNSSSFSDSGSITIEGDSIAFTGNTRSTNTLTGVTGIDESHAVGTYAFQTFFSGIPIGYTFSEKGKIRLWPVPDSIAEDKTLFISYYRRLPKVTSLNDSILLSDVNSAIKYVAYRIKKWQSGAQISMNDETVQTLFASLDRLVDRDNTGQLKRVKVG